MHSHSLVQNIVTLIPPSTEVITLDEAKQQARVEITDDDALITDLITSARQMCETMTRRTFNPTTFALKMDRFPWSYNPHFDWGWDNQGDYGNNVIRGDCLHHRRIYLPQPPLMSVNSISYVDLTGMVQMLDSTTYTVDLGGDLPGSILLNQGQTYPPVTPGSVVVSFTAGYDTVPSCARTAVKLLVAHLYENRMATSSVSMSEVPLGVRAVLSSIMWGSYR